MLIGARLNWLLSHGKGKTWGDAPKKFIQIDIEPKEMDSNVEIVAPVVGDIGSCVAALLAGHGRQLAGAAGRLDRRGHHEARRERRQDGAAADEQQRRRWTITARSACCAPSSRSGRTPSWSTKAPTRSISRAASSTCISRASASTSAPGASWASAWAMPSPRRSRPASRCLRSRATRPSASPAWRSRRSAATSCRSASSSSTTTASIAAPTSTRSSSDPAPTVFVKGSRYDKMIEAFGGVGVNATSPDELKRAVNAAMDSGKPTLINAVLDPAAGSESGRIGNLNPQSALKKKWTRVYATERSRFVPARRAKRGPRSQPSRSRWMSGLRGHRLEHRKETRDGRSKMAIEDQPRKSKTKPKSKAASKKVVKLKSKKPARRRNPPTACRSRRPSRTARPARRSTA